MEFIPKRSLDLRDALTKALNADVFTIWTLFHVKKLNQLSTGYRILREGTGGWCSPPSSSVLGQPHSQTSVVRLILAYILHISEIALRKKGEKEGFTPKKVFWDKFSNPPLSIRSFLDMLASVPREPYDRLWRWKDMFPTAKESYLK